MAKIWNDFLIGETNIREGDFEESSITVTKREILYRRYITKPYLLTEMVTGGMVTGENRNANQALYDMSILEEDVDPKYVFYIVITAKPSSIWYPPNEDGKTCIHNFSRSCHYRALSVLKDALMLDNLPTSKSGETPLHCALYFDDMKSSVEQEKTLRLLCSSKHVHIDAKDNTFGRTALYIAFKQQSIRAMKVLLEHGASILPNLKEFAQQIPILQLLYDILFSTENYSGSPGATCFGSQIWQDVLLRLTSHPRLKIFLAPTISSSEMIDYNHRHSWLSFHKWRYGKIHVLNGMILFRVREELRASKRNTISISRILEEEVASNKRQVIHPPRSIDEKEEENHLFEEDLRKRHVGKEIRRKHKGKLVKAKRENEEQLRWDKRQAAQKDKMENEYQVNLAGLIVG